MSHSDPATQLERRARGAGGSRPRVFVVGGGFGGLSCVKALRKAHADVTLIDRRNYHLFQPLLYQVATAALSSADIAASIREALRHQSNARVVLSEVRRVDLAAKRLEFDGGSIDYDYLVLAAGATHAYFGNDDWAASAPGLKTIEDAIEIRKRILLAFEVAEYEGSEEAQRAALTFAVVGGGPTGVELAGAIKEIAGQSIQRDFRSIDTTTTRVILCQGGDRVLKGMPDELSARAKRDLEEMGVEVIVGKRVVDVGDYGVTLDDGQRIHARNVFWAAGVRANPIGQSSDMPCDKAGRVHVEADLSVPGHPHTFVIGDMASATSGDTGRAVPGVAPAALQMGRHVGRLIAEECTSGAHLREPADREPFRYVDKGTLATIGKARAVGEIRGFNFTGFLAWFLWGLVHITFLVGFGNRIVVVTRWFYNWATNSRDARLITGEARIDVVQPRETRGDLRLEHRTVQVTAGAEGDAGAGARAASAGSGAGGP